MPVEVSSLDPISSAVGHAFSRMTGLEAGFQARQQSLDRGVRLAVANTIGLMQGFNQAFAPLARIKGERVGHLEDFFEARPWGELTADLLVFTGVTLLAGKGEVFTGIALKGVYNILAPHIYNVPNALRSVTRYLPHFTLHTV